MAQVMLQHLHRVQARRPHVVGIANRVDTLTFVRFVPTVPGSSFVVAQRTRQALRRDHHFESRPVGEDLAGRRS